MGIEDSAAQSMGPLSALKSGGFYRGLRSCIPGYCVLFLRLSLSACTGKRRGELCAWSLCLFVVKGQRAVNAMGAVPLALARGHWAVKVGESGSGGLCGLWL